MRRFRKRFFSTCGAWLLFAGTSYAVPMAFTDHAAFQAAAPGALSTLDFDALSAGTIISSGGTVGGITFTYDFGGVQMMVSDVFSTTSPSNFLGTDDADIFQDGDDFGLSFAPTNALGMFFLSADFLFDGDISFLAGGVTASLEESAVEQILPDGSHAYFLGVVDTATAFTSAAIVANGGPGGPFFFYNVDDISIGVPQIPEPGTLFLLCTGVVGLAAYTRPRNVRSFRRTGAGPSRLPAPAFRGRRRRLRTHHVLQHTQNSETPTTA
jgi:PEP-CTERM motif